MRNLNSRTFCCETWLYTKINRSRVIRVLRFAKWLQICINLWLDLLNSAIRYWATFQILKPKITSTKKVYCEKEGFNYRKSFAALVVLVFMAKKTANRKKVVNEFLSSFHISYSNWQKDVPFANTEFKTFKTLKTKKIIQSIILLPMSFTEELYQGVSIILPESLKIYQSLKICQLNTVFEETFQSSALFL